MTTRTIFLVGLEPLEERYTGQWARWLPETLAALGTVVVIEGTPLRSHIEHGAFLDTDSSAHYKATQLAAIAVLFAQEKVRHGDLFWFSDVEFPGMESVRYLARLHSLRVGIFGFLHAGSYTRGDVMTCVADVGRYAEVAWVSACDAVFLGSEHHRRQFIANRLQPVNAPLEERLVVTGNPFRGAEVEAAARDRSLLPRPLQERVIDILYPHRPDQEKRPYTFTRWLRETFRADGPWARVAFTTGRASYPTAGRDSAGISDVLALQAEFPEAVTIHAGLKREALYALMGRARIVVSTTIEENFGYAMVEAIAAGAVPFMPCRYAHAEYGYDSSQFPRAEQPLYEGVLGESPAVGAALRSLVAMSRTVISPVHSAHSRARRYALAHLDGAEDRIVEAIRTRCEEMDL